MVVQFACRQDGEEVSHWPAVGVEVLPAPSAPTLPVVHQGCPPSAYLGTNCPPGGATLPVPPLKNSPLCLSSSTGSRPTATRLHQIRASFLALINRLSFSFSFSLYFSLYFSLPSLTCHFFNAENSFLRFTPRSFTTSNTPFFRHSHLFLAITSIDRTIPQRNHDFSSHLEHRPPRQRMRPEPRS